MGDPFSSWQVRGIERALAAAVRRHQALADNVANADTPGYKRQDVRFWGELQRAQERLAVTRTHPGHLPGAVPGNSPRVVRDSTAGRPDGNNVDIEFELASLAENGLWYQALLRQLGARFAMWRTVIEGRK
ncbi:MAG: flagellar basal body rod protein FlgB [Bacillota bacterium]|nr:flagellar basal body rod protein FlgB [Bacillota bacterium]MDI7248792.1 flagellar basal body rod protein FlgB [Bacillota bacterium]